MNMEIMTTVLRELTAMARVAKSHSTPCKFKPAEIKTTCQGSSTRVQGRTGRQIQTKIMSARRKLNLGTLNELLETLASPTRTALQISAAVESAKASIMENLARRASSATLASTAMRTKLVIMSRAKVTHALRARSAGSGWPAMKIRAPCLEQ